MSNSQEEQLRITLALAGVEVESLKLPKILSHGNLDGSIKHTHRETNNKIQECLNNNSLGECIHITGEMRALTDPFHRYLCEEISQKKKSVFRVVYNLPEEYMANSTKILESNLEGWALDKSNRKWYEELRTIYSIANRSVNLYAFDTSNEIQYSVFGNRFILLQEKHQDRARKKHTWLLESESVNQFLTDKAEKLIKASKDVDGGNYRKFTSNISSIASKMILSALSKSSFLSAEKLLLDSHINDFTETPHEIIESLNVMGFIERINNTDLIKIAQAGREFIK